MHALELQRMGAHIELDGQMAIVNGRGLSGGS